MYCAGKSDFVIGETVRAKACFSMVIEDVAVVEELALWTRCCGSDHMLGGEDTVLVTLRRYHMNDIFSATGTSHWKLTRRHPGTRDSVLRHNVTDANGPTFAGTLFGAYFGHIPRDLLFLPVLRDDVIKECLRKHSINHWGVQGYVIKGTYIFRGNRTTFGNIFLERAHLFMAYDLQALLWVIGDGRCCLPGRKRKSSQGKYTYELLTVVPTMYGHLVQEVTIKNTYFYMLNVSCSLTIKSGSYTYENHEWSPWVWSVGKTQEREEWKHWLAQVLDCESTISMM